MEAWQVSSDGRHIYVEAPKDTISRIPGTVTFDHEEVEGRRCCNEIVPATHLGTVGEAIVRKLRSGLERPRISVTPDGFKICLSSSNETEKALGLIRQLESQQVRQPLSLAG